MSQAQPYLGFLSKDGLTASQLLKKDTPLPTPAPKQQDLSEPAKIHLESIKAKLYLSTKSRDGKNTLLEAVIKRYESLLR